MKLFFHAVVVLLSVLTFAINAAEPNFVKTTEIGVGKDTLGNSTDRVSIGFSDGLNRGLQSKVNNSTLLTSGNGVIPPASTFLTTSTFYDDAGRPIIATKTFNTSLIKFVPGSFSYINDNYLKNEYAAFPQNNTTDKDPIAYSETKYYADPLSRVYESALPGLDNCMSTAGTGKVWYFGVGKIVTPTSIILTDTTVKIQDGLIITDITVSQLDELYNILPTYSGIFTGGRNHLLTVSKDASGKFSQVLKDLFGRTVATAARKTTGENGLVVSKTDFDILGNVLKENPPVDVNPIGATEYLYNTLGQVIRTITPDKARDTFIYNNAGLLADKSTLVNSQSIRCLDYKYDDMQRLIKISIPHKREPENLIENFYDTPDNLVDNGKYYNIPTSYLGLLTNCRGRLVATISYNRYGVNPLTVVDLYSYDEDGNVSTKYKMVPGLPVQEIKYTYDIHGKILSENIVAGGYANVTKEYTYDSLGRLKEIVPSYDTAKKLVAYTYNNLGQLTSKKLNGKITTKYEYTINGQVNRMSSGLGLPAVNHFEEQINYQPDGNIQNTASTYKNFTLAPPLPINQIYTYDNLNRLLNVYSQNAEYRSSYSYDDVGRIKTKTEGAPTLNPYLYYQGNSRLQRAKSASGNDYVYDYFGNLVVDKTKRLVIQYDWRNLPVKFSFYNAIPSTIGADLNGGCQVSGIEYTDPISDYMAEEVANGDGVTRLLSTVTMVYDAGGNRVLKMESGK